MANTRNQNTCPHCGSKVIIRHSHIENALLKIFEEARMKKFDISDMIIRKPNLEDVFLKLTGKRLRD